MNGIPDAIEGQLVGGAHNINVNVNINILKII
jgi:hypothetical protein